MTYKKWWHRFLTCEHLIRGTGILPGLVSRGRLTCKKWWHRFLTCEHLIRGTGILPGLVSRGRLTYIPHRLKTCATNLMGRDPHDGGGKPLKALKISTAGVRGIVGETLTPELVVAFAGAFGTYMDGGRILVSRDTRPSGQMVRSAVIAGLIASGCEVVDLGICPTPAMQRVAADTRAVGGLAVTAGHNPEQWNALKFVRGDGIYLNEFQGEELLDIFHQGEFIKAAWDRIKPLQRNDDAVDAHIRKILKKIDAGIIRKRKFTVALDCCNGACSLSTPKLLGELGCKVVSINDRIDEPFPHDPEPSPRNMHQLRALAEAAGADIGFAHDADGERLGIVTDRFEALPEEFTFALAAEMALSETIGPVVTNLSTSHIIDMIAQRHGAKVIKTKIGQVYVSEGAKKYGAVAAGEGSGGVILPGFNPSHDAIAAIAFMLQYLAREDIPVSDVAARLPRLKMVKNSISLSTSRIPTVMQKIRERLPELAPGAEVNNIDGVKVIRKNSWVQIRPSNTQSLIRIISEAADEGEAGRLNNQFMQLVREMIWG